MKYKYTLLVKNGRYESDHLTLLLLAVFVHRCEHFFKGEGWVD